MIELFDKYIDWKILAYFLRHPQTPTYVKELARKLRISPSSANQALKRFTKNDLLRKEEKGLSHLYTLNNDLALVRYLKTSYILALLYDWGIVERFRECDESLVSLAIYGSYANGTFDEKSDLDLLTISSKSNRSFLEQIDALEELLEVGVSLERFSIAKWHRMKRQNEPFYKDFVDNHILLYGSELL